jgi:hypothetical protein
MPEGWKADNHGIDLTGLDHLYDKNIHSLSHYCTHPEVHLRIFSGLIGAFEITPAEVAIRKAFPRVGPKIEAAVRAKAEEFLKSLAEKVTTKTNLEAWVGVYRELREWAEAHS